MFHAITANIFLTQRAVAAPIEMETPSSISSGEYCKTSSSFAMNISHHAIRKVINFDDLKELRNLGLIKYTVFETDALDENGVPVKYDGVVIFELYNRDNTDKYVTINGQYMTFQQYLLEYYKIQFKTITGENTIVNCQHSPIPANLNNVKLYFFDSHYTNSIAPANTLNVGNSGATVFYYNGNGQQINIGTFLSFSKDLYTFYNNYEDKLVDMPIN